MYKTISKKQTKNTKSFSNAWSRVRQCDAKAVQEEIMTALSIRSRTSFYNRMHGVIAPRLCEAEAIEGIFAKYGVSPVWDN